MEQERRREELLSAFSSTPPWERRTPGRAKYSSPALIRLSREPLRIEEDEAEIEGHLSPLAKGMVAGLFLALPCWAGVGFLVWFFCTG